MAIGLAISNVLFGFCSSSDLDVKTILSEGYGTIIQGDTAQARDEAIQDARVKALEKVMGIYVDSQSIIQNEMLLDSTIRDTTQGFIKDYRILEEGIAYGDLYRVKIEAWVVHEQYEGKIETLMSNATIIISIAEWNLGVRRSCSIIESELTSNLSKEGYTILDAGQLMEINFQDRATLISTEDKDVLQKLGRRFLSNILIKGDSSTCYSQKNGGIISCIAQSRVSIVETSTGKIVAHANITNTKGFSNKKEKAGLEALSEVSSSVSKYVLEQLAIYFRKKERNIVVKVSNLTDPLKVKKLYNLLKSIRWVRDVQNEQYAKGWASFNLRYPEKTIYLANRLRRYPDLELIEFDWNSVLLKALN